MISFIQNSNWVAFALPVMWLRILLILFLSTALTFILTFKFPKNYIKNKTKIRITIFIISMLILGFFVIPKGIWKARIIFSPPQTIRKTQSFSAGNIDEPSNVTLLFTSSSSFEDIINFYTEKLAEDNLCLGQQSLIKSEVCFSKEALIASGVNKDWTINKTDKVVNHKSLNWGYFAILEKDGNRVVQFFLY